MSKKEIVNQMAKVIDLTPKGCLTKEGQARIQRALDGRAEIDFQCYQKLAEICDTTWDEQLIKTLCLGGSMTETDAKEFVGEIYTLLRARKENDDEFLRAVADLPARPTSPSQTNGDQSHAEPHA